MDHSLPTSDPPTLASIQASLVAHDANSKRRYKKLMSATTTGGATMDGTTGSTQVHHMYAGGAGGTGSTLGDHASLASLAAMAGRGGWGNNTGFGGAAGLGGAALGFVAGALINGGNNGGLFGNRNNGGTGDLVTTTHLQSSLNHLTASQNQNAVLQQLATIQQLIPENEGRVQLAIANSQIALSNQAAQGQLQTAAVGSNLQNNIADARHSINDNIHANGLNNANYFAGVNGNIAASTAATNQIVREAKDVSESGFAATALQAAQNNAATQLGISNLGLQAANNTGAILTAIRDDGDKTRAQAAAINDATLNRIIVNQANEIIELKGDRNHHQRQRETELTITQNVNQNQAQNQQQQQQQQQFLLLSNIASSLNGLTQIAHATNQNVIAGNTGAVTTGAQSANPVNVA